MKIIGVGIIAFLLFLLQRKIYEKLWDKNLKVSVAFSQTGVTEGEMGEVVERIENRKWLPLIMLKVKFQTSRELEFTDGVSQAATDQYYRSDMFQVGANERITRRLPFQAKKRGYYHIKNIDLMGTDLFLSEETGNSMTTDSYLYVYPRQFESREFQQSLQKLNGEILVKRHLLEDPFEYRGIREYQPYDDIRSINWKATARTGALKVNQKNYTTMQSVNVFLNVEDNGILKKDPEVEASLQIVMGLAAFFLAQGIQLAVYSNGRDVITEESVRIKAGAGAGQQEVIGKALARMDTKKEPRPFAELFEEKILEKQQGTVTLLVSPNGYEDFLELLEECQEKGLEYTWFYPYTADKVPQVPKTLEKNVRFIYINR